MCALPVPYHQTEWPTSGGVTLGKHASLVVANSSLSVFIPLGCAFEEYLHGTQNRTNASNTPGEDWEGEGTDLHILGISPHDWNSGFDAIG